MIEFKGECGHMIRARDEDAGKLVRCSYCGQQSLVAQNPDDRMAGVFDELERTGEYDPKATRAGRKQFKAANRPPGAAEPLEVARKMIYVAVAVIAVVVAWKYAADILRTLPTARDRAAGRVRPSESPPPQAAEERPSDAGRRVGLLATRLDPQQQGVYVTSVPGQASVYALAEWDRRSSILNAAGADFNVRTNTAIKFAEGRQVIATALRVNHPELMEYPGFAELRRQIESGACDDAALEAFFIADGSIATRIEKQRGTLYIVRVFEVEIAARAWEQVTALFLPDAPLGEIVQRLPPADGYGFDAESVTREMTFYKVPPSDHQAIIRALRSIGMVVYAGPDSPPYRVFQIDLQDGNIRSYELVR